MIDVHTHILPPGWPDLGERCPRFERIDAHTARIVVGGRNFRDITDQCWDPARRLADMDRDGVERQVISTVPVMFSYWAPPEQALSLCRHLNDHIAGVVAAHPGRFVGLATLEMGRQARQEVSAPLSEEQRGFHGRSVLMRVPRV